MSTNWTDPTITSSTHVRIPHINELRSVVDKNRLQAGLGSYSWTDSPVSRFTHIRAVHFNELRNAVQDLWNHLGMGTLPNWSYGSAPSGDSTRHISARDTTDLRNWVQQYQNQAGPSYDPYYWGVDSAARANDTYPNTQSTVFDYVTLKAGESPLFWGRYIGGSFALNSDEVDYIHGKSCKILPIYNGATSGSVSGTYQDGQNDAKNAINAAQALGVPYGKVIFADIEASWSPSVAWIKGWSDTIFDSIYAGSGGFYANTSSSNPFNGAYCAAYNGDSEMQISVGFIYADEPEPGCTTAGGAPAWGPSAPPCNNGAVVAWQYAESCYMSGVVGVDEDLVNATGWYYLW
ncbi:MAG: glycoside hydrolase domain-containing protein [Chloroflexota bacterium]